MSKSIVDLRVALFETLEGIKSGALDVDKGRQINEVAKTIIDSARVEVEFLRVSGGDKSPFIEPPALTTDTPAPPLPNGIVGVTRHILQG